MTLVSQETSRAIATIYINRQVKILDEIRVPTYVNNDRLTFTGVHPFNPSQGDMAIMSVQTSKLMGDCSGTWRLRVKSSVDLTSVVHENDWVDIVMTRHDKGWHVMRGPVDGVIRERRAIGGATEIVYTIVGRDHGKILETQQVWYDQILNELAAPVAASRIASNHDDFINGNPATVVRRWVEGHLTPYVNNAVGYWVVPSMPNVVSRPSFIDNLRFVLNEYSNLPSRGMGLVPHTWSLEVPNVWALAKHYADEELCEIYVDLAAKRPSAQHGDYLTSNPYSPDETVMALFVRDRPFLCPSRGAVAVSADQEGSDVRNESPYFWRIPQYDIKSQEIVGDNLAVSGLARVNAFFYAPQLAQDLAKSMSNMALPLVDIDSIKNHGMRRKNVESIYFNFRELNHLGMIQAYRDISRDIHCMNHILSTGTMSLKPGRPDIRIGGRARIFPLTSHIAPDWNESYYVEGVSHSWDYANGVTTDLVLSRGWRGDDNSLARELNSIRRRYRDLKLRDFLQLTPGEESAIANNTAIA